MAAKKQAKGTAVARVEPKSSAVALPDYLKNYAGPTGAENIDNADVTIPRLKIGQSMSDEVKQGKVKEGAIFLNITGQVLAEPGVELRFTPIAQSKEFILWRDRKDGGGIFARAKRALTRDGGVLYLWDKPNQAFEHKIDGKTKVTWKTGKSVEEDGLGEWGSEIPGNADSGIAATAHHNYVVSLPDHGDMVAALSFSRSSAKKAKDFNALIKLAAGIPMFARVFTIKTIDDKSDLGEYKNYDVKPAGMVEEEQKFLRFKAMNESLTAKGFTVDQSDEEQESGGGSKSKDRGGKY